VTAQDLVSNGYSSSILSTQGNNQTPGNTGNSDQFVQQP
jgi:hypothetical protein